MNTKRSKLEKQEKRIVTAARSVFVKHGYAKAKMRQIAETANLAEGTLYLYYKNKNAIVKAVLADHWQEITAEADKAIAGGGESFAQIRALASYHLDMMVDHWPLIELGYVLYYAHSDDVGDGVDFKRLYASILDRLIERGQDKGVFAPDLSLPFLRDLFYGTLEYAARTLVLHNTPEEKSAYITRLMQVLRPYLVQAEPDKAAENPALLTRLEQAVQKLETLSKGL